jgi:flagellar protein FlaG
MADPISITASAATSAQVAVLVSAQLQTASPGPDATAPGSQAAAAAAATANPNGAQTQQTTDSEAAKPAAAVDSTQALDHAVKSLQDYLKPQESVSLQVDRTSGETLVKVVNVQTKQLILQIPSTQVLAMAQRLRQMANPQAASGVLVDHQG